MKPETPNNGMQPTGNRPVSLSFETMSFAGRFPAADSKRSAVRAGPSSYPDNQLVTQQHLNERRSRGLA